jgi:hypothetical protein
MMYVSGETAEASAETTGMIEEIVRQQVIEMVNQIQSIFSSTKLLITLSSDNAQNKHPAAAAAPYQLTT